MLQLVDVWKGEKGGRGKRLWTLAGVTTTLPAGRRIALLGPDPLANALVLGLLSGHGVPDRGMIRRSGLTCWPLGDFSFLDIRSTLKQNASFIGRLYGVSAEDMMAIAVSLTGVKLRRGRPISAYPAGEQRLLALGITLSIQFSWYFVNENVPGVPEDRLGAVAAAVADRFSRGGVVWATTDPTKVAGYCDAAVILDQGRMTFYDAFADAAEDYEQVLAQRAGKPT